MIGCSVEQRPPHPSPLPKGERDDHLDPEPFSQEGEGEISWTPAVSRGGRSVELFLRVPVLLPDAVVSETLLVRTGAPEIKKRRAVFETTTGTDRVCLTNNLPAHFTGRERRVIDTDIGERIDHSTEVHHVKCRGSRQAAGSAERAPIEGR